MKQVVFRAWHLKENKMYYRAYQKFFYVLLCDHDPVRDDGLGKPVKRSFYGDCYLMESTGLQDILKNEIFEGDIVRVKYRDKEFKGVVEEVPDSFGAGKIHPLQKLLKANGVEGYPENLEMEILGNEFENPEHGQRK